MISSAHSTTMLDNTVQNEHAQIPSRGVEDRTTFTSAFAETSNSGKWLVSSSSKWVIDSGASDHMTGNSIFLLILPDMLHQPELRLLMEIYPK